MEGPLPFLVAAVLLPASSWGRHAPAAPVTVVLAAVLVGGLGVFAVRERRRRHAT